MDLCTSNSTCEDSFAHYVCSFGEKPPTSSRVSQTLSMAHAVPASLLKLSLPKFTRCEQVSGTSRCETGRFDMHVCRYCNTATAYITYTYIMMPLCHGGGKKSATLVGTYAGAINTDTYRHYIRTYTRYHTHYHRMMK